MVLLPNGDLVIIYVARLGYIDAPDGYPQFGVEAIVSHDNGQSWDLDHRYLLHTWQGTTKGKGFFWGAPQGTSSLLLANGEILTVFGTGYRIQPKSEGPDADAVPHDIALIRWRVNDKGLNNDRTVSQAPFDSDLRNKFDPSREKTEAIQK